MERNGRREGSPFTGVGPVFVKELAEKIPLYNERHMVKAGLTGWAQINYPYGASIDDARSKLSYDLYYVKNFSILFDTTHAYMCGVSGARQRGRPRPLWRELATVPAAHVEPGRRCGDTGDRTTARLRPQARQRAGRVPACVPQLQPIVAARCPAAPCPQTNARLSNAPDRGADRTQA